ncbi:nucleoside triphosphate pyrophosphohydrolase family protein [Stratiformator vulcanicus]|uniref:MazG nucleotide pyrophosphohydrolase domain protein n=1 Tax=Stratiformator vulcanicus TaxID=2527980 RepID=A0A517QWL3_9PLAN|nr:nucleoside triphosphate pyrophosphohydrolase family protein [Stratiformator vulcanicus]QDT35960.1 MazG nucleotide pyrophosphohydrolase domain protein [Stratiformator vulcanicus]
MDFRTYQNESLRTDQTPDDEKGKLVPLLGLAGEVGTLLSEYKKLLRDGSAHERFDEQVAEELGDLLWYIANVASKFDLDLEQVAKGNLEKTRGRWPEYALDDHGTLFDSDRSRLFDDDFPPDQQIPRQFTIQFKEQCEGDSVRVIISRDDRQIGDELTDNAYEDDGYRFHDVFHFSYAAMLGWSPIARKLLKVKRKADEQIDEVEDGARARIIEELISQLAYTYAREHKYLEGVGSLDYHLLKTIQSLVADREVKSRSLAEWEQAILAGYKVWRQVREHRGGTVEVDLPERRIAFLGPPGGEADIRT